MAHKLIAVLLICFGMLWLAASGSAQQIAPFHFSNCPAPATCCNVPAPMMTQPVPGGTPTVIPQGPVNLYGAHISNSNAASEFIQFFNATAQPAFGATPVGSSSWIVNANQDRDISVGHSGMPFSTGIMACCSTSQMTFTAVGGCGFLLEWY
jgi:hypothetical protein